MYSKIKDLISWLIPKKAIFRYEYQLRFAYYLFFIGNDFQCNICNKKIRSFVSIGNDRLCPRCGSIERSRRLWDILENEFINDKQKILDFSPSRCIYRMMKKRNSFYISSDLSGNFISDVSYDIRNIDSKNENFDLIICYHVLEHIKDDAEAIKEMHRVLRKNGYCIVQTPFKEGETYEDNTIVLPEQRELNFGQSDHVRIYSIGGLKSRLENAGFKVEKRVFHEEHCNIHGFSERETVLICHKPD